MSAPASTAATKSTGLIEDTQMGMSEEMDLAKRTRFASQAKSTCDAPPEQAAETTFFTILASKLLSPAITLKAFPSEKGFKTDDLDSALATARIAMKADTE
jgi:hypothetical protein